MEKLNIAELLKDCPSGMELDCTMYDNVKLIDVDEREEIVFPIRVVREDGITELFTEYGQYIDSDFAKCVIYPKGKTTWDGFIPPSKFKDGDVVYVKTDTHDNIIIYKKLDEHLHRYVNLSDEEIFYCDKIGKVCTKDKIREIRLATEKEKEKLFQAIKERGYKWNAETKELEKLIERKFKVGDRVRLKSKPNYIYTIHSLSWDDKKKLAYRLLPNNDKHLILVSLNKQDNYELVPNKFDLTTLKPFDKVLVRCSSLEKWDIEFFKKYNKDSNAKYPFICLCNNKYNQCVPFEGNEYLLDTTEECYDYYKNWK